MWIFRWEYFGAEVVLVRCAVVLGQLIVSFLAHGNVGIGGAVPQTLGQSQPVATLQRSHLYFGGASFGGNFGFVEGFFSKGVVAPTVDGTDTKLCFEAGECG